MRTSSGSEGGRLPNLLIIGKCTTSSLHYYLSFHLQICMSQKKELDFFAQEFNWCKGVDWYKSQFTGVAKIYGEASPSYTHHPFFAGVPQRMASLVPDAQLIYLIRDPIERVISDYIHEVSKNREDRTFTEAVTDFHNNRYLTCSLYSMQLEQYLQYFSRSQILVLANEELYAERQQTLEKVFRFLAVDVAFLSEKFNQLRHQSSDNRRQTALGLWVARLPIKKMLSHLSPDRQWSYERRILLPFSREIKRPQVDPEVRCRLIAYFQDDSGRLQEYAGRKFIGWCV